MVGDMSTYSESSNLSVVADFPGSTSEAARQPITRTVIADCMPAFRRHVRTIMEEVFPDFTFEHYEIMSGSACITMARQLNADLIVVDCSHISGIKLAESIWQEVPALKILFWAQRYAEIQLRSIEKLAPADRLFAYVLKTSEDEELRRGLSSLLSRKGRYIDTNVRQHVKEVSQRRAVLTGIDMDTICDVSLGLTDRAIASRRNISLRAAHNRVAVVINKVLRGQQHLVRHDAGGVDMFNSRVRTMFELFRGGVIDPGALNELEAEMQDWLTKWLEDRHCLQFDPMYCGPNELPSPSP